jgi:hypothetical protein
MQRRAVLTALACLGAGPATGLRVRAAAADHPGVLAWGSGGCWVAARGASELTRLPDAPAPAIDPVPVAGGLWLVAANGKLRCWEPAVDPAWRLRCTVPLEGPVHALAASPDGRWALAAHGQRLSLADASGAVAKTFEGSDLGRTRRGAATVLFSLPQRQSFFAAWPALGESWEISLDPDAAPIFDGLVHDYRMGEGIPSPGYLGARRAPLGQPMPDFGFADHRVPWVAGMQGDEAVVVHLDVRRRIAALRVPGANPGGAALRPASHGRTANQWWLPAGHEIHVFDAARWVSVAAQTLPGPVRQLQATDDAVWALVGTRAGATLFVLRDGQADAWQRVDAGAGALSAVRAAPRGPQVLVLHAADAQALLLLESGGAVRRRWTVPAGAALDGVAWWPLPG